MFVLNLICLESKFAHITKPFFFLGHILLWLLSHFTDATGDLCIVNDAILSIVNVVKCYHSTHYMGHFCVALAAVVHADFL